MHRCLECVFASCQLTTEEAKGVRTLLARRPRPSGWVDADMSWNLDILQLPESSTLSFLEGSSEREFYGARRAPIGCSACADYPLPDRAPYPGPSLACSAE